jgi:hypothetical protein
MDLQGPPSEHTQTEKLRDLKKLAQHYARDQGSCDDTRISYLEFVETEAEADLTVTVLTGKTPDSAVMTTRAGKYH